MNQATVESAVSYRLVDADEVEPMMGVLRRVRRTLGVRAFGINQADMPPNFEHYPEHDETSTGQEEVFLCIAGSGTLSVDGEPVELVPGRYVLVMPEAKRKIVSGPDGLTAIAVGAPVGKAYEPHGEL
jgi:quercetin dioxygenase-like cupin family protein